MSGTLDGSDEIGFLSLEIGEEITCAPIGPGPQARVKQRDGSIRLADTLLIRCRGGATASATTKTSSSR